MSNRQIPRVAICLPSKDEIKTDTSLAISALMTESAVRGVAAFALLNQKGAMISFQRNELVRRALELPVDYLLWIDSDMVFPADALARLLSHDKDIVGATYSKRVPPYETLGRFKDPEAIFHGGLADSHYLPGGMILIKADVYRKVSEPWYFETYVWKGESSFDSFMKMLEDWSLVDMSDGVRSELYSMKGLRPWLESQQSSPYFGRPTISEDINFCRKVVRHGYEIWCDVDLTYQVIHISEHGIVARPDVKEPRRAEAPGSPQIQMPLRAVNA